jgi:GGDEF domain-containing protein
MDQASVLRDPATGLHVRWYFWLRVLDEVNRCARYGTSFGLLLLEAETGRPDAARPLADVASRLGDVIRTTDLGGALGPGRVGVILSQQDVESARRAADRIVDELARKSAHGMRWSQRLLCYPADGAVISNLLTGDTVAGRTANIDDLAV